MADLRAGRAEFRFAAIMARDTGDSTRDMTALIILLATIATAMLSAVFGMAGGLILMGVLAALLPVASAMVVHGAVQSVSNGCLLYTSPSPRDVEESRMPSSA